MDIVYDGNNSNSVCFVGKYVNLRTFLWELITPRVIWKPRLRLGFQITLVVINSHRSVLKWT